MRFESKGFTLAEIIITVFITSIVVAAIAVAFNTGLYARSDIENVNVAYNIAQAKMEELKNTEFTSLADSGPTADADFPNFNVTVNVAEGQNPMQVDVTVSWQARGGQTSVTLTTLVADY